ncbi:MAG: hypothetical protein AVDCRST_MAG68-3047, partial [uncultured Gemmatimonadetes bacterium]
AEPILFRGIASAGSASRSRAVGAGGRAGGGFRHG